MKSWDTNLAEIAVQDLRALGYSVERMPESWPAGKNLYHLKKDGKEAIAVIQVRSADANSRYTVGIIVPGLERADCHVTWMETEHSMYIIPSHVLLAIHNDMKKEGVACYTGKRQWRVNFFPETHELKPQIERFQKEAYDYDISIAEYAYKTSAFRKYLKRMRDRMDRYPKTREDKAQRI